MTDLLLCPRCNSHEVIPRVRIAERGADDKRHDLQVEIQRRPRAMIFKRPERVNLTARVCCACGFTELYVDSPRALYTAYLQADSNPTVSATEELDRTREALAESQIRLGELEEKLAFVEQLLERDRLRIAPPKASDGQSSE
jgi:hypothetical protein